MLLNILKNILAVIVSFVFIAAAYFFVIKKGETPLPWTNGPQTEKSMAVVVNLNQRLAGFQNIDIKTDFFSMPIFTNLSKNYKKPLPTFGDGTIENPFQ